MDEKLLLETMPGLARALEWLATGIELAGIVILVIGVGRFGWDFIRSEAKGGGEVQRGHLMNHARLVLGRYILVGLEVLIAADLILTMLAQTWERLAFLGALVAMRSVMSWLLELEIRAIEKHEKEDVV